MKDMIQKMYSLLLVALQLAALVYLALTGPLIARELGLFLIQCVGLYIGLAALWRMAGAKWRIVPDPHPRTKLVTRGIYRHIRHPMYTSLLIISLVWIVLKPDVDRMLFWLGLAIVLWLKMLREERLLQEKFGDKYHMYSRQTKRLIPGII